MRTLEIVEMGPKWPSACRQQARGLVMLAMVSYQIGKEEICEENGLVGLLRSSCGVYMLIVAA